MKRRLGAVVQLMDMRVLVTGGTSGPGRPMAQARCEGGARVAVTSRSRQREEGLLDPAIMAPPIVWLASASAAGVHDQRIEACSFGDGWRTRETMEY